MKPVSAELLALLATRQFFAADLYTFQGGNLGANVLRFCGGDQDIVANGYRFAAGGQIGPYFDRKDNKAKGHQKIGVEVDTLVIDVIPGAAMLFGANFLQAVHAGLFDGAEMILEKAFMPSYGDTSRGLVRWFVGRVAEIDAGRSVATFTVNSHLELLNLQLPRNLYQPGCINNLGDASCGVDLASYTTTGSACPGASNAVLLANVANIGAYAAGSFDTGTITFTSGALSGLSATVKSLTATGVTPTDILLAAGTASWTVPDDFDTVTNRIELVGEGGNGNAGNSGGGGAGAAYAASSGLALARGTTLAVQIGTGGTGKDTSFDGGRILAKAGPSATGNLGGVAPPASHSVGQTVFAGGNGGNAAPGSGQGAGGGGAAGPHGPGGAAPNNPGAPGGSGGDADNGNIAGAAPLTAGNPGTAWGGDGGPGSGAGGDDGGHLDAPSAGGSFGGGGGGGGGPNPGGAGAPGAIRITYGNSAIVNLLGYLPAAPAGGDSFTLSFGCDKSMGANGCPKFSNQARYRGFRFVPQPATAV